MGASPTPTATLKCEIEVTLRSKEQLGLNRRVYPDDVLSSSLWRAAVLRRMGEDGEEGSRV
jgi:hypothetical protein